jgi:hypothetical protein
VIESQLEAFHWRSKISLIQKATEEECELVSLFDLSTLTAEDFSACYNGDSQELQDIFGEGP